VGGALAAAGSLLALLLGVSRTTLAMARDRRLPHLLARVDDGVPRVAELAIGAVVAVLVATVDLRHAIGFSSFGVLVYYAIANASAWTLGRRVIPSLGLLGCLLLAATLPTPDVIAGCAVCAAGICAYGAVEFRRTRSTQR
jgi:APA family basic amino acid/polyamine antiporter